VRAGAAVVGLLLLAAASPSRAQEPLPPLSSTHRVVARLALPVEEVSGAALAPGAPAGTRDLLVVSDEGRFDPAARVLRGALFRVRLRAADDGLVAEAPVAIAIRTGAHLDRFDPAWLERDASPVDLESLAAVPGTTDLWLLGGERNPEDSTDNGANRLYLVRWPAGPGDDGAADLVACFRVPDLVDDLENDRLEGVAVLAAGEGRWHVWAFKERTGVTARRPGHLHGLLERQGGAFRWTPDTAPGWPPLAVRFLGETTEDVLHQADACTTPDGGLWVLDRWKRVLHEARADAATGALARRGERDLFDVVRDVPGETAPLEPGAPGKPERRGFGRHEAVAVGADGWVFLACDRGGRAPSVLTVLAPR
jgi:hypothetical protein